VSLSKKLNDALSQIDDRKGVIDTIVLGPADYPVAMEEAQTVTIASGPEGLSVDHHGRLRYIFIGRAIRVLPGGLLERSRIDFHVVTYTRQNQVWDLETGDVSVGVNPPSQSLPRS
jgi:hypothetical protein